jgi:hypothetical protein
VESVNGLVQRDWALHIYLKNMLYIMSNCYIRLISSLTYHILFSIINMTRYNMSLDIHTSNVFLLDTI